METNEKFCPVCKNKNERNAVFCKHCGALLGYHPWDSSATTVNTDALEKGAKIAESLIDEVLIPEDNVAIYAAGASRPIYVHIAKELVFGRKNEQVLEASLLDLSELGGYQMGISRRHAVISRVENDYELTDLGSTNGSWLNDERLVPFKPYPLVNGSQLRFGRMRILFLYRPAPKIEKSD